MKILSLFMCLCVSLGSNYIPFNRYDAADQCFLSFIESEVDVPEDLQYIRTPLYDFDLNETGWKYSFTAGAQYGYALIAEMVYGSNHWYEIEEVYFGESSAFDNITGLPVYVTFNSYLEYRDGFFYDIASGTQLTDDMIEAIKSEGFGYRGNDYTYEKVTETVSYTSSEITNNQIPQGVPSYLAAKPNYGCANIAGAIITGYLDTINENLIPNFVAYYMFGNKVVYKGSTTEVDAMTERLHTLMATDSNGGTTYSGFVNGMNAYAQENNSSLTMNSVMNGSTFDYNAYDQQINQGNPVAIFLSGFSLLNISGVTTNGNVDTITSFNYNTATHIVVGFGRRTIKYYDGNSMFREIRLLRCMTNFSGFNPGFINVNGVGKIDKAIAISVNSNL